MHLLSVAEDVPEFSLHRSWVVPVGARRPVALALMGATIAAFALVGLAVWGVPQLARGVGSLCATANVSNVVDASVVLVAQSRHAAIVTSDEPDIRHLASSVGPSLTIYEI